MIIKNGALYTDIGDQMYCYRDKDRECDVECPALSLSLKQKFQGPFTDKQVQDVKFWCCGRLEQNVETMGV